MVRIWADTDAALADRCVLPSHPWSGCNALQELSVEVFARRERRNPVPSDVGQSREIEPWNFGLVFEHEDGLEAQPKR